MARRLTKTKAIDKQNIKTWDKQIRCIEEILPEMESEGCLEDCQMLRDWLTAMKRAMEVLKED